MGQGRIECASRALVHLLSRWLHLTLLGHSQSVTEEWLVRTACRSPRSACIFCLGLHLNSTQVTWRPTRRGQLLHPKRGNLKDACLSRKSAHVHLSKGHCSHVILAQVIIFFMARLIIRFFWMQSLWWSRNISLRQIRIIITPHFQLSK